MARRPSGVHGADEGATEDLVRSRATIEVAGGWWLVLENTVTQARMQEFMYQLLFSWGACFIGCVVIMVSCAWD